METYLPLVSIITATYNADAHLESSIESVKNQTYRHFEYFIIDGGSEDRTVEIIKENQSHITYWLSEKDNGIYDAWNKGLDLIHGDWVLFLGADDRLLPDSLANYINYISLNIDKKFDYISSRIKRVRPDGSIEGIIGKSWEWEEFKYRMTTSHPGSFHSKQLFLKYGNYNTDYQIVSDYEMLLRPKQHLKAGFMNKITVLMSTGGRFLDFNSTKECLKMFSNTNHLNYFEYLYIFVYMYLREIYLRLTKLVSLSLDIFLPKNSR
jgi:glycosyltransferase involved in cell wall biosynthesis